MEALWLYLQLLLLYGIRHLRSERHAVVGSPGPVFAVSGEDVVLPCAMKPEVNLTDARIEWFRHNGPFGLVHFYEQYENRNADQIKSYQGRTQLFQTELLKGNASLKLSAVQKSDAGDYKCLIISQFRNEPAIFSVVIQVVVGSHPVIALEGFDASRGLRLHCSSEGWNPEPDFQWWSGKGERLSPETIEKLETSNGFRVKQTLVVHSDHNMIRCSVRAGGHIEETHILISGKMFESCSCLPLVLGISLPCGAFAFVAITAFLWLKKNHLNQNVPEKAHLVTEPSLDWELKQKTEFKKVIKEANKSKAPVTLNAASAHPSVVVSRDGKTMQLKDSKNLRDEKSGNAYHQCFGAVGNERISGSFYFEVDVAGATEYDLGVTEHDSGAITQSDNSTINLEPETRYWVIRYRQGLFKVSFTFLSLSSRPERIGVFVDYKKKCISFYDIESNKNIYSFIDQNFKELRPFLGLGFSHRSTASNSLTILP
ncbi:hypothetical protein DNTS_020584 [Danionella cerebrum]|uniref:Uncharacterized protein n=1 Tax=Danionella cerebrum TaxID=2873325 RepID=A0A553R529_9TELE|nr:hypothetical protein DNTS_020584 [Danionella translucida]